MPDIENNIMSTFTIGGKTYEIEDSSARSNIQQITSDISNYYTKSETYNKTEVDNLIGSQSSGGLSVVAKCRLKNDDKTISSTSNSMLMYIVDPSQDPLPTAGEFDVVLISDFVCDVPRTLQMTGIFLYNTSGSITPIATFSAPESPVKVAREKCFVDLVFLKAN